MSARKYRKTKKIANLLENRRFSNLFRKSSKERGDVFVKLVGNWKNIVGPELYGHVVIKKITGNTIYLTVPDSSWKQNLLYMQDMLLENIRNYSGVIKKIRLSVEKNPELYKTDSSKRDLSPYKVDEDKINSLDKMLEGIEDESLKETLRSLYIKKEKFRKFSIQMGEDNLQKK